jgi:hypothetical protein
MSTETPTKGFFAKLFSYVPSWLFQFNISKEGAILFGFKIGWLWICAIILLTLYVLYDKGYIFHKQTMAEQAIGMAKDSILNRGDIPVNIPIPTKYLQH